MSQKSLQQTYAPENHCFGCGPANAKGLRIESFPEGEEVTCIWTPARHHEAFEGMLNGGICGALLDCHSNWTAAWHLMNRTGVDIPPCTVTAEFHVKLLAPTPSSGPVRLSARVVESSDRKAIVEATLAAGTQADAQVTCTCRGVFIAVREGHPAYHRW